MPTLSFAHRGEAEGFYEKPLTQPEVSLIETHRVQADDLLCRRNGALRPRGEFAVVRSLDEGEAQAVRIGKWKRAIAAACLDLVDGDAIRMQPGLPEFERSPRDRERNLSGEPGAVAAAGHTRPRKEGQVGAGVGVTIGVEQMIGLGGILVHTLLHEAHAEHARVEVEVFLRVASDAG